MNEEIKQIVNLALTSKEKINSEMTNVLFVDLLDGIIQSEFRQRYDSWKLYIEDISNNQPITETQRNGLIVPAIFI